MGTFVSLATPAADEPGMIEYSLRAPSGAFEGLAVELCGRAFLARGHDPRVDRLMRRLEHWRYGLGTFKVDYALSGPVPSGDARARLLSP